MLTGFSSVFFVPSTPGSKLLKMLKITEEQNMIGQASRIKFIETSGRRYIDHLRVKDPYQINCLPEERCFICTNSNGPTNCKSTNIGYSIICKTCKERNIERTYEGETARNAYLRGNEHQRALERKSDNSVLYKHIQKEHREEENSIKFQMKIVGRFKSPLCRQIDEGVRIQSKKPEALLNSKAEFYGPAVKRKVIEGK